MRRRACHVRTSTLPELWCLLTAFRRTALVLLVVMMCWTPAAAQQGHCDPGLPLAGENPLHYRERGSPEGESDRCERLYVREVGSTTLLVASLTERVGDFDPRSDRPLVVSWKAQGEAVHLRARGLRHDLHYLYLESLDGEPVGLRRGQALRFEEVRGRIRTLQLMPDHLALNFHGQLRGMSTGTGEAHRSLMPTYLEWLQARHGLSLLWGTAIYLFGLIAGVMRWWGMRS